MQSASANPGELIAEREQQLTEIEREIAELQARHNRIANFELPKLREADQLLSQVFASNGAEAPAPSPAPRKKRGTSPGKASAPARRRSAKKKDNASSGTSAATESRGPAGGEPAEPAQPGGGTRALVVEVVENAGDWIATRDVAAKLNGRATYAAVSQMLKHLHNEGALEHNGRQRTASRYRTATSTPAPILPPLSQTPAMGGLSSRTRKSIERAEREAAESNGKPAGDELELEGRVRDALEEQSSTLRELADQLDVEVAEVSHVVAAMRERGDVIARGKRMPRRDQVYGLVGVE